MRSVQRCVCHIAKLYCIFFIEHARNGHISTSGLKSDVTIVFLHIDFTWTATVWLVVVLTADRYNDCYIAICRPLHVIQYSILSRLRRVVAVVWLLAVVYMQPSAVLRGRSSRSRNGPRQSVRRSCSRRLICRLRQLDNGGHSYESNPEQYIVGKSPRVVGSVHGDVGLQKLSLHVSQSVSRLRRSIHSTVGGAGVLQPAPGACCTRVLPVAVRSATDGGTGRQHTWTLVVVVIVFVVCQLPTLARRVLVVLYCVRQRPVLQDCV